MPFGTRLAILLGLLGAVAAVECAWRRERATRWREYSFLLACAVLGGLFGAAFDQLSVAISPRYFEIAKGIPRGPGFRLAVTLLGFRAGFLAGAVAGGALMVAGRGLPLRAVARTVPWIPAAALAGAAAGLLLAPGDPFRRVLGLHTGLYAGAIAGTVLAALRVRRAARSPQRPYGRTHSKK